MKLQRALASYELSGGCTHIVVIAAAAAAEVK